MRSELRVPMGRWTKFWIAYSTLSLVLALLGMVVASQFMDRSVSGTEALQTYAMVVVAAVFWPFSLAAYLLGF